MGSHCRKAVQKNAAENVLDQHLKLLPALGLVLPDDALVPVNLALDPVLKYATRLGELLNNFVATFAIATMTGRKVQGLPNGKFMHSHVLLQQAGYRRLRRHPMPFSSTRFEG